MNRDDAKEKFREADRLFNAREYAKALEILADLDRTYPNQRAVLFPMARCLGGLRRLSEAIDLADRIYRDFEYQPAKDLRERLQDKHARISSLPPQSISSFDPPAETPKPGKNVVVPRDEDIEAFPQNIEPVAEEEGGEISPTSSRVAVLMCVGLVLLSYGVYAGVGATAGKPALEYAMAVDASSEPTPWQEIMFLWVGFVVHLYALACLPMYAALRFAGALRFDSFGPDFKDAATYTLYGFLLAPLILIGWIVFFFVLRRGFEITTGQTARALGAFCVLFCVLYAADWALVNFALNPMLVG